MKQYKSVGPEDRVGYWSRAEDAREAKEQVQQVIHGPVPLAVKGGWGSRGII